MTVQFKIVFSGELREGADQTEFVEKFSRYFKASNEQALALINAGREVVIKKGISAEEGAKYLSALEKLGMVVRLEPMEPDGLSLVPMENQGAAEESGEESVTKPTCPKCGSERLADGECLDCGIIIAKYLESGMAAVTPPPASASEPDTDEEDPYRVTERTRSAEPEREGPLEPESVSAANGWTWIADGFDLFRRSPLGWLGAFIIAVLLSFGISMVPFLGSVAVSLFSPVIAGGFMIGCREQDQGYNFGVSHLFRGFQENFGQLLLVGLMYFGATILIGIVAVLMLGSAMFAVEGMDQMAAQDPAAVSNTIGSTSILLSVLVIMALFIPVLMAYWFAPALVAIEGVSAVEAMKLSFSACLKNILPFLLYGVIALLLSIVAALPFFLGFLVLGPVLTASVYTGYRDIFRT
jgi:uncharacterized membrane protein